MQDEYFTRSGSAARSGSARTAIGMALLGFLMGGALVGWLALSGKISLGGAEQAESPAALMSPSAAASSEAAAQAAPSPLPAAALALDGRIGALEQRLSQLDLRTEAASGNAARAEGLLIALAARRAIERGAPLGYLEDQLKLRFSEAKPKAVDTIIAAAKDPVTVDQLAGELDSMADALSKSPDQESGWSRLRREFAGLFVIRREAAPSTQPADRIDRAKLLLRTGRYDEAADEVARLPGSASAADWIAAAHRYAATERALDLIETAALLEPRQLKNAEGAKVEQPSPVAAPAA